MTKFKLTNKQQIDLESIVYFIPPFLKEHKISDKDIEDFFNYSDKGLNKDKVKGYRVGNIDGFNVLLEGKRWRGIHIGMYEEGILDGSVPYSVLLQGIPKNVMLFISKEIFKGIDKELIERVWIETN